MLTIFDMLSKDKIDLAQGLLSKEIQRDLKEVEDYKYALDESCIVAITDQKGIIRHVNENFCKISKYSAEELLGQDHRIINAEFHSKEFIRDLWVTIAHGKIWRGELKNRAKDGSFYWVDTTIVPFLNEKGKPYQYLAIRADITERKKAQEEILRLNEELEVRVEQRTEELEAFTYSVSHDLRAPLRAINGYANILAEDYADKLDPEANRLLSVIQLNAKVMGELIDSLLSFSRLGKKELKVSSVDMNELTQRVVHEINKSFPNKAKIKIDNLLPVMGDYSLLSQVMTNFISNAVKYSGKQKKPLVEINSYQQNNEVIYSVKDNGAGFEMEYSNKLFNVFQRLHTVEEFEGIGVGLAIVKRIITKHGGRVWAEGKPGNGAVFYFSLPVKG